MRVSVQNWKTTGRTLGTVTAVALAASAPAGWTTPEAPMLSGQAGWTAQPSLTVGETVDGYQGPGILDGLGACPLAGGNVRVLVNHELEPGVGYPYRLFNGTVLTGARISYLDFDPATREIVGTGPAIQVVYDRHGAIVTDPAQVNETGIGIDGFSRFCSSQLVRGGTDGFADTIYFTGEESGVPYHPHGGTLWALDVETSVMWAVPDVGRGAWENVTPIDTGKKDEVALLLGNDTVGSPLYLYVGKKKRHGGFLERNGLVGGKLYVWVASDGSSSPEDFNGPGAVRTGKLKKVDVRKRSKAGHDGYDDQGYLDDDTLLAEAVGHRHAFQFSRPEDLTTNPANGRQVVFASTGRGQAFPSDNWGTLYRAEINVTAKKATITIVFDSDALPIPDEGIRSPDNLSWAADGFVYAQEDRSTSPSSLFGGATGIEASIWQLDPWTGAATRIAVIDRSAVVPAGTTDDCAGDLGCWESSGVLDVTDLFDTAPGETLLLADVQAHGIADGPIGGDALLGEGGQLLFLSTN